jgi:DNA-binding XRE family transcriptional regulator
MAGHQKFSKLLDKMSPERRAESDARVRELQAEMVLAELRKYSGMTQQQMADILGISQPSLSKMESQDDMQISTLSRLVRSLGGQLELIAHLPKGDIRLTQFATDPTP